MSNGPDADGSNRDGGVVLEAQDLSKRFGGIQAVKRVSLTIHRGSVHGLIGPNGSGKTTTFDLLSGITNPDAGLVRMHGRDITRWKPQMRARAGMARTFQQVRLWPEMTAAENVMTSVVAKRAGTPVRLTDLRQRARSNRSALDHGRALLERVGVSERSHHVKVERLGVLDRHLIEIARALALEPKLLMLDEPLTGMVASEVEVLENLMANLARSGVAVLLVEHRMDIVMRICDRLTVLDFGNVIFDGTPEGARMDSQVIDAYLGSGI